MIDYKAAREQMVDCQVRTNDVTEHRLISALLASPREQFVPADLQALAYSDSEISLSELGGEGRYLMPVARFACLAEAADITKDDIVLVIGSGGGYSLSVISQLASSVVAIEENPKLVEYSSEKLSENGFDNVVVLQDTFTTGCPKEAPYDVILIEGSVEEVPETILDQLSPDGRLIAVYGHGNSAEACVVMRHNNGFSSRSLMNCSVRPLPGFEKKVEFAL